MKQFFLFIPLLIIISNHTSGQSLDQRYPVIPKPSLIIAMEGFFNVTSSTIIVASEPEFLPVADSLRIYLSKADKVRLSQKVKQTSQIIRFERDPALQTPESYKLIIHTDNILIQSSGPAGAFYAVQTIRQLLQKTEDQKHTGPGFNYGLPCCSINDTPAYGWRGFHLDVARHFFSRDYLFKIIDWLSSYKLNKLHLHLTDDQGWRVQLEGLPLLTSVGAWRTFNDLDSICLNKAISDSSYQLDPRFIRDIEGRREYGGFYTKGDIRKIIAYAAAHFIEVIPEIDMPGHMSAAIGAYPYLSSTSATGWGTEFSFPICPCKNGTMEFSFRVWDEIADLFPSHFMHIGSDEVEKDTWEASADCKDFMERNAFSDSKEIQNYFVKQVQKHLEAKGKKVIAWDDVIEGKVDSNLVMMYWRDWIKDSPARCSGNGNKIVLTPWDPFYLSSKHTDKSFRNLYEYDPQKLYPAEILSNVLGLQACVWTEEIPSEARFEYLVFPRLQALSEVCWSSGRDWNGFVQRLQPQLIRMTSEKIRFRQPDLN